MDGRGMLKHMYNETKTKVQYERVKRNWKQLE